MLFVLIAFVPLPVLLATLRPSVQVLERIWPASPLDDLARPGFIDDGATIDSDTSLPLVTLGQQGWLRNVSRYFDAAREGREIAPEREAARRMLCEVDEHLQELEAAGPTQAVEARITAMMSGCPVSSNGCSPLPEACGSFAGQGWE